jgi:hypothetical protein
MQYALAGHAAGTGEALTPTVTTTGNTQAPAGLAAGTGDAYGPTATVSPPAGVATATGAAYAAAASLAPPAGLAEGTGTAGVATAKLGAQGGDPTGVGSAYQPTILAVPYKNVSAGIAEGTGAAGSATPKVDANAAAATATGDALEPTVETGAEPLPVWTTPADGVSMTSTPTLAFTIPALASAMHFYLELDTADTFDTGDLRTHDSSASQTSWEYWNDAAWTDVPAGGVAAEYAGNEARYTVTSALASGTWYRRIRAGV